MNAYLRRIEQFTFAVAGLAAVYVLVAPGRNTAKIIQAQGDAFSSMVKIMTAERAIEMRDIPRVEKLLGETDDATMTELFAGLPDIDLDWIETMLADIGKDPL